MTKRAKRAADAKKKEHPALADPFTVGSTLRNVRQVFAAVWAPVLGLLILFELPWIAFAHWSSVSEAEGLQYAQWSTIYDLFVGYLASAAVTLVVIGHVERHRPGVVEAVRSALRIWGALLLAQVIASIWILVFGCMLIVPGVLRALSYAVITPVVVVERSRGRRFDPLERSAVLMLGHRKVVFGVLSLFWVVGNLPAVATLVLQTRMDAWMLHLVGDLGTATFRAPFDIATAILYLKAVRAHDAEGDKA